MRPLWTKKDTFESFELVKKEGKEERRQGEMDCGTVRCVEHKG